MDLIAFNAFVIAAAALVIWLARRRAYRLGYFDGWRDHVMGFNYKEKQ